MKLDPTRKAPGKPGIDEMKEMIEEMNEDVDKYLPLTSYASFLVLTKGETLRVFPVGSERRIWVVVRRSGVAVLRVASGYIPKSSRRTSQARRVAEFPIAHWGADGAIRAALQTALTLSIGG